MINNKEWIDTVRSTLPFIIHETATYNSGDMANITFPMRSNKQGFELHIDEWTHTEIDGLPAMLHLSKPKSIGTPSRPVAPSLAPAQSAVNMVIVWVKELEIIEKGFDNISESYAPHNAITIATDDTSLSAAGNYTTYGITPHRTDGKPAILYIQNLKKWYSSDGLHRKGGHPALRSDYVGAKWAEEGRLYRSNGPHTVGIESYQEFHKDGNYNGMRFHKIHTEWDSDEQAAHAGAMDGPTNPLSNRYFGDQMDEFAFAAVNC